MLGNKGISTGLTVLLVIFALGVGAAFVYVAGYQPAAVPTAVEYDGEFTDADVPDEVSGTDVQVERAYGDGGDNFSIYMNTTTYMNASRNAINGNTFMLATMIDIDDWVEELTFDATMGSNITGISETGEVYLLKDADDVRMGADDALAQCSFDIDSDSEDFDGECGAMDDGEYVLVIEWEPTGIIEELDFSGGTTYMYSVDVDVETNEDVDTGVIKIYANGA